MKTPYKARAKARAKAKSTGKAPMKTWAKVGIALAGAALTVGFVIARALERRAALSVHGWPDAAWAHTLELGARLSRGRWAPWDVESGVGALEQLMGAAAIAIGGTTEGAAIALGAITAAAALFGSIAVARALPASSGERWGFGLLVLLFALGADLRAPLGLALVFAALELCRNAPRPSVALAALTLAVGFEPRAALFGIALLAFGLPLSRVRSGDAGRALRLGLGLSAVMLAVLAAAAAPLLARRDASGPDALLRLGELGPPGPDGHFLLGAALLALAVAARSPHEPETRATLALAPPAALGLFGLGDASTALWPLAAVTVIASARIPRTAARVGVGVLALAALVPSMKTLASPPAPTATLERSDDAAARWIAERHGDGCVALVGALAAVSVEVPSAGPRTQLDARAADQSVAAHLREGVCPWAVARMDPRAPDEASRGVAFDGAALLELGRRYRFAEDLGPSTRGLERRETPLELATREEHPQPMPSGVLQTGEPLVIELAEPAPLAALFVLEIELEGAGPAADVFVHGARVAVRNGRSTIVVPASVERAAMAWTRGAPPPDRGVQRLSLRALPSTDGARLTVRAVRVFDAPTVPFVVPTADRCDSGLYAGRGVLSGGLREGEDLRLSPLPTRDAVHTWAVRPCPDHCLLAEAGLEAGEGPVELDITYDDGAVESLISHRSIGVGWRQPIEVPLEGGAGRLSLRARGAAGAELRIRRPRVLPCGAAYSLLNAEHEWRRVIPPEAEVSVVGDEVRIPVLPTGAIPVRLEIPVEIPPDGQTCLAVEVTPHDTDAPIGALVGIRRGDVVRRLHRQLLAPGAPPLALQDIALGRAFPDRVRLTDETDDVETDDVETDGDETDGDETDGDETDDDETDDDEAGDDETDDDLGEDSEPPEEGEWVWLVFSTWATARDGGGTVSFVRAQLHPCGEPTNWSF